MRIHPRLLVRLPRKQKFSLQPSSRFLPKSNALHKSFSARVCQCKWRTCSECQRLHDGVQGSVGCCQPECQYDWDGVGIGQRRRFCIRTQHQHVLASFCTTSSISFAALNTLGAWFEVNPKRYPFACYNLLALTKSLKLWCDWCVRDLLNVVEFFGSREGDDQCCQDRSSTFVWTRMELH